VGNREKLQELHFKLQFLHEQIKEIEKQAQLFNNQLNELTLTKQSLDDFKKLEEGTAILVPINPGIYAKAELKNNKDLLVNVGSNVSVKKNVEDTKKLINDQIEEIKKVQAQLLSNLQKLTSKAALTEREFNKISSEME
jgi:prefoldin alpha subunit